MSLIPNPVRSGFMKFCETAVVDREYFDFGRVGGANCVEGRGNPYDNGHGTSVSRA